MNMNNWAKNLYDNAPKWLVIILTAILTVVFTKIQQGPFFWLIIIISVLLIASVIFIILYIKTKRELEIMKLSDKIEFVSRFGVKWLVNHTKKIIEEMPYCTCCEPPKIMVFHTTNGEGFSCVIGKRIITLKDDESRELQKKESYSLLKEKFNF
ncbi:MAG: hypothetical protein V1833_06365 [Elusimicrobiota bacterium]